MQNKVRQLIIFIGGFFLFFVDRILKYFSLHIFTDNFLFSNFIGWHPFKNFGIAFSIPIPTYLSIFLSAPILLLLLYLILNNFKTDRFAIFSGLILLFFGSLSNFIDRIYYKATIDYWLLGTAVLNLADILIVVGIFLFFLRKHIFDK